MQTSSRELLVVRHAKSDWSVPAADFERPLNRRGHRDAPAVGNWLAEHRLMPDAAVVSPAARTRATWQLLAEAADIGAMVREDRGIYLGEVEDLADAVRTLPPTAGCGVLVGHAPGCPDFVEWLTDGRGNAEAFAAMRAKFPTAAVAVIDLDADWADLAAGAGALRAFAVCRG